MTLTLSTKPAVKKQVQSYVVIFLAAIVYTIGLQGFLQVARIFSTGISAFAALPTFLDTDLIPYVSLFAFALNIPLVIFFWKKNKRRFMIKTIYFLVIQAALGSLFIIHEVNDVFKTLLFYNQISDSPRKDGWPILLMGAIGATLMGFAMGVSWKFGGSTGGTDMITYYYSSKRQKSVGSIMFIISTAILMFSFAIAVATNKDMRDYWLLSLAASIGYILVLTVIINFVYPKYSKVELTISSEKVSEISKAFKDTGYQHSWRIEEFESGYHKRKSKQIKTIIFLLESRDIIRFVHSVDPHAWISMVEVKKVWGRFNQTVIEEKD